MAGFAVRRIQGDVSRKCNLEEALLKYIAVFWGGAVAIRQGEELLMGALREGIVLSGRPEETEL